VEQSEGIRRDQREDGLSIRALTSSHRVHRRTVRRALSDAVPPPRKTPEREAPVLGPSLGDDPWLVLTADLELPPRPGRPPECGRRPQRGHAARPCGPLQSAPVATRYEESRAPRRGHTRRGNRQQGLRGPTRAADPASTSCPGREPFHGAPAAQARVDPELVGEQGTSLLVGPQCLSLSSGEVRPVMSSAHMRSRRGCSSTRRSSSATAELIPPKSSSRAYLSSSAASRSASRRAAAARR